MKKLLIIAPNYFGFHDVIFMVFKKYSGYKVELLEINGNYKYKSWRERIYNFFLKNLTNKNIKTIRSAENLEYKIASLSKYDVILVNRPDMLSESHLNYCKSVTSKFAVLYWDSFAKIKGLKNTRFFFDTCFSFDVQDCENYNLIKTNNFYFHENSPSETKFDVFFLGVYDNRFDDLVKIFRYLKTLNLKVGARLFNYEKQVIPKDLENEIELTKHIVAFSEAYKFNEDTKIILDLGHKNQAGLSFRPFEALGLRKKIITTNSFVKNYDFYNENNIAVIENIEEIGISKDFFIDDFHDLQDLITHKYSAQNWVKTIINSIENEKR